ncbi:hypothetical protein IMZ48_05510 [Candidatus Bathyarchaeota archaeon]|nr:hypothetical protein [Candidatus Bathyarchaeota archaeon]
MLDTDGITHAAAAAFDLPLPFQGKQLELASDRLTPPEIADVLSKIRQVGGTSGVPFKTLIRLGRPGGHVAMQAQVWARDIGHGVDTRALEPYHLRLTLIHEGFTKQRLAW